MKIHDIAILFFIFWGSISQCAAQKIAVKTNLLYGTYASSPNLETEFGISPRGTVDLGAGSTGLHPFIHPQTRNWCIGLAR